MFDPLLRLVWDLTSKSFKPSSFMNTAESGPVKTHFFVVTDFLLHLLHTRPILRFVRDMVLATRTAKTVNPGQILAVWTIKVA